MIMDMCVFRLKTPPRPPGQRTEPEGRGGVSRFTHTPIFEVNVLFSVYPIYLYISNLICFSFPSDVSGFRGHGLSHVFRHRRVPLRLLHHSLQRQRPLSKSR